jgi:hypothetical protein
MKYYYHFSLDMIYNDIESVCMALTDDRYYEKLELVFQAYERSLDIEIALTLVPMSDEERERMKTDDDLNARISVCDAKARNDLMVSMRELAEGAKTEGVRFQALKELGRTLYPKRFKDDAPPVGRMLVQIVDDIKPKEEA